MRRNILSLLVRSAVTGVAFWWVFRSVNLDTLYETLRLSNSRWLLAGVGSFFLAQLLCILRWRLLVPEHPALHIRFLADSFFVGSFFNTFLPTTVGGDVVRGYDLIKATGEWRGSLASILMDRLIGMAGFAIFALFAWIFFPPAREDPVLQGSFFGFCLVVLAAVGVLGSRRILQGTLRPFGKIGLGALSSHAKQFQEALLNYFRAPRKLLSAFWITLGVQLGAIFMFAAVSKALNLSIPFLLILLVVPIIILVAQLPISLNGFGVREGAAVLLLGRGGVGAAEALSLSLICAVIPISAGVIGGILFLLRRQRRR